MANTGNSMDFAYGDAYPSYLTATAETGLLAQPDKDDQEALQESEDVAEITDTTVSRRKYVFLAVAGIVALVVFFGAGGKVSE